MLGSLDKWLLQEDGVSFTHNTHLPLLPLSYILDVFFSSARKVSVQWWEKIKIIFSAHQTAYTCILPNTRSRSSQTLTAVLLKGCHDNPLKSLVCQREREGLCARNHAGWCKTHTGSDFCGSSVQFGDESRAASVAITLAHLSCDTLGLISSTLNRAPVWHPRQFVTLLSL